MGIVKITKLTDGQGQQIANLTPESAIYDEESGVRLNVKLANVNIRRIENAVSGAIESIKAQEVTSSKIIQDEGNRLTANITKISGDVETAIQTANNANSKSASAEEYATNLDKRLQQLMSGNTVSASGASVAQVVKNTNDIEILTNKSQEALNNITELSGIIKTYNTSVIDTKGDIGTLSSLTTANKSSIVDAINEINAKPTGSGGTSIPSSGWGKSDFSNEVQSTLENALLQDGTETIRVHSADGVEIYDSEDNNDYVQLGGQGISLEGSKQGYESWENIVNTSEKITEVEEKIETLTTDVKYTSKIVARSYEDFEPIDGYYTYTMNSILSGETA